MKVPENHQCLHRKYTLKCLDFKKNPSRDTVPLLYLSKAGVLRIWGTTHTNIQYILSGEDQREVPYGIGHVVFVRHIIWGGGGVGSFGDPIIGCGG